MTDVSTARAVVVFRQLLALKMLFFLKTTLTQTIILDKTLLGANNIPCRDELNSASYASFPPQKRVHKSIMFAEAAKSSERA